MTQASEMMESLGHEAVKVTIPDGFMDWAKDKQQSWVSDNTDKLTPDQMKHLKEVIAKNERSVHEVILKQRDRDAVEELIDKNGLAGVVETISEIAFEKQEHIEQGDNGASSLSKSWGKDAKALDTLSAKLSN